MELGGEGVVHFRRTDDTTFVFLLRLYTLDTCMCGFTSLLWFAPPFHARTRLHLFLIVCISVDNKNKTTTKKNATIC